MALTLRTLLAFFDDLLAPTQTKTIGRQIGRNHAAQKLLSRMKDLLRQPSLKAPPPLAEGDWQDPNEVAEYLDHTLPRRDIPAFERATIESDEQLAEVAACHRVLAMIMGEPAEVSDSSRQRMYEVLPPPAPSDAQHSAEVNLFEEQPPVETSAVASAKRKSRPLASKSMVSLWGSATALVLFLVFGILFLTDAFGPLLHTPEELADAADPEESVAGAMQPTSLPAEPQPVPIEAQKLEPQEAAKLPRVRIAGAKSHPQPGNIRQVNLEVPERELVSPREGASTKGIRVAEYPRTTQQVLLRYLPDSRGWAQVAPGASLTSGDVILAPPGFQPRLLFDDGTVVELFPETVLELGAPTRETPLVCDIWYGRVGMRTTENAVAAEVSAGAWTADVTLSSNSLFGIQVEPEFLAGTDPRTLDASRRRVDLFLFRGQFAFDDGEQQPIRQAPVHATAYQEGQHVSKLDSRVPDWSQYLPRLTSEERRATNVLLKKLPASGNIESALRELVHDRHQTVRFMAAHWFACVGEFSPTVGLLDDPELRSIWRQELVSRLRQAGARGPRWAERVLIGLQTHHGKEASDVFRMLWGYTPEQLDSGEASRLVGFLEHDRLAYRAVAHWNLEQITGMSLHYEPAESPLSNRASIRRWYEKLRLGQLVPKTLR